MWECVCGGGGVGSEKSAGRRLAPFSLWVLPTESKNSPRRVVIGLRLSESIPGVGFTTHASNYTHLSTTLLTHTLGFKSSRKCTLHCTLHLSAKSPWSPKYVLWELNWLNERFVVFFLFFSPSSIYTFTPGHVLLYLKHRERERRAKTESSTMYSRFCPFFYLKGDNFAFYVFWNYLPW